MLAWSRPLISTIRWVGVEESVRLAWVDRLTLVAV